MPFVKRFSVTECGAMTFTGNTLGLSQELNSNNAGTRGSIGAFITLDNTKNVPTYPLSSNAGTTLDWRENGSEAILNLPPGSEVLYAELIWGGNYISTNQDISADIDTSVTFNTPNGSYKVTPTNVTANDHSYVLGATRAFYIRSSDVTLLVQNGGAGTYSTEGVPGLLDPLIASTNETNNAGWTLAVIYKNANLPVRNMNLYVGAEGIVINLQGGTPVQDINIGGFLTPSIGNVTGRLLVSAQEGDAVIGGDQMLFGPNTGSLNQVSGLNNDPNNFFGSQINKDDGSLDTSGSYGDRNHNPYTTTNVFAGRQGWDITNVDVSPYLTNSQSSAVIRATSTGDAYMPNAIGIQIDSIPILEAVKFTDKSYAQIGEEIIYTVIITNKGQVDAVNTIFKDTIAEGLTLVSGSFSVNGNPIPNANTNADLEKGVNIGDIKTGEAVAVTYTVTVNEDKNLCGTVATNKANISYEYGCTNQRDSLETNEQNVNIECVDLEVVKTADTDILLIGDTVVFTTTITNTGSIPLNNIVFIDEIPDNMTFVEDSVELDGVEKPGANPETGVPIGTLNPGESVTVAFAATLNKITCPLRIANKAVVNYEYQFASDQPVLTGSKESNLLIIRVAPTTFKQLSKDEVVKIPPQKPDVEEILNTLVDIKIINTRVIKTIIRTSNEGQVLTGFKLVVEGRLNQKIEYIADESTQSVHSAHFIVPFSSYIILPSDYIEGTPVEVEAEIEDIYTKIIDKRTIFKNITFRLFVKQAR